MKYLYGDSSDFPLQRDFLGLLDYYLDTGVKAITLENTVFDLKESIKERRALKNAVLEEMDRFLSNSATAISGSVEKSKEKEAIAQYAERSKDFLKRFVEDGKTRFSDEIFQEIKQFEEKVNQADEENRKVLESFFIQDPIPVKNRIYTVKTTKEGNSMKVQLDCEKEISYVFTIDPSEVPFWDYRVIASDFQKGVEIPVRMKKPFLKKELVPEIVSLDDYYLGDLVLSGEGLEAVFRRKLDDTAERIKIQIKSGNESVEVYHADEGGADQSIVSVPELKNVLNIPALQELGKKIVEQTNTLYAKRQKMESIRLSGNEVLKENLIYELMQKVAELFAPTIADIKKHGSSETELSLKTEDDTGKRSEIYLKKSQVKDKLGAIKKKGSRLVEILSA